MICVDSFLPVTSGNLKADLISNGKGNVSFDIVLTIRQKETFPSILITDTTLLTRTQLGSDSTSDTFFTQYLLTVNVVIS